MTGKNQAGANARNLYQIPQAAIDKVAAFVVTAILARLVGPLAGL